MKQRLRLARGMDEAGLRAVFSMMFQGDAKIDLVLKDGSRSRIGRVLDFASLRPLMELTRHGEDCRLELVFDAPGRKLSVGSS